MMLLLKKPFATTIVLLNKDSYFCKSIFKKLVYPFTVLDTVQTAHRGCLATVKGKREPMSLRKLRDPMNEVILKLRMEGTFISSEEELQDLIMRVQSYFSLGENCMVKYLIAFEASNLLWLRPR